MRKEIFQFLKQYSCDIGKTNRLLVSAFVRNNSLQSIRNKLICSLLIGEGDEDYPKLLDFEDQFTIDSVEKLSTAFEFVISPAEKIVTGAIYTPESVRVAITERVFSKFDNLSQLTVCDPACGCGGFLVSAASFIHDRTGLPYQDVYREMIFGLDLKEYSILRSKIILSLLAIVNGEDEECFSFNLYAGNALNFDWSGATNSLGYFDIVVGNPPYVSSRHVDDETKELCQKWQVSSTGHPDLYIPFFEIGHTLLKDNGVLGYITMNTFFKSMNGRALRSYFSKSKVDLSIYDFGFKQVFDSRHTYTCICILSNTSSEDIRFKRISDASEINRHNGSALSYADLDDLNGWNLVESFAIKKIESTGTPFSKLFKTSSGIATLRNNIYIFTPIKEDLLHYYNDEGHPIEKDICLDVINTNKLTIESDINSIRQKIIFPYVYQDGKAIPMEEEQLSTKFPSTYNYLISKKNELAERDKGNRTYPTWYSYGRTQALAKVSYRLFFPHIAPKTPNFILSDDDDLLFYNGLALISSNMRDLLFAKKIMKSKLFWFYITKTSKPYSSGFYSISRNYIKAFGIPNFTKSEVDTIINETCSDKIDQLLLQAYGLSPDILLEV